MKKDDDYQKAKNERLAAQYATKKSILPDAPFTVNSPPREPVWGGPSVDGISQTMLGRYLTCPERFRVLYVEGLQPTPMFRPQIEFGNLWHAAEESFAQHGTKLNPANQHEMHWHRAVYDYGNKLGDLYPMQRDQIIHWIKVCIALFPAYIDFWKKHPDMKVRKPLEQEQKFCVDYTLPSGRVAKLRGKRDSVDLIVNDNGGLRTLNGTNKGIWLQENKSKSQIDRQKIDRMLRFDLQTMMYLLSLDEDQDFWQKMREKFPGMGRKPFPVVGVRYNVVRRSTHKTAESMMKKVQEDISIARGDEWFCRWNSEVSVQDMNNFKYWALNPILENLLDDYEWWAYCYTYSDHRNQTSKTGRNEQMSPFVYQRRAEVFPNHQHRHFTMPYIGYNPLSEGMETDVDNYLFTGSEVGLHRVTKADLFPELA